MIGGQGKLTPELERRVRDSWSATEIEDLYLPFRPKRQTRAEIARKRGLEPLAKMIMAQNNPDVESKARNFLGDEVKTAAEAIQGAKDIIAEWVNEDERARDLTRAAFAHTGMITSKVVKGKEEEGQKYKDYFDFQEPLRRVSSHRLLALRRGEAEGFLKVSITPDTTSCAERLRKRFVRSSNEASRLVEAAVDDAFKRLLKPAIETEFAKTSKEKADEEAIRVFTRRRSESSPVTSGNCSWRPRWDRKESWESIPASVRAASWSASTRRAISCIMRRSTRIHPRTSEARRPPRWPNWSLPII